MAARGAPQRGRCNPHDATTTTLITPGGAEHHLNARRPRPHLNPCQSPNPRVRDGIDPSQESPRLESNWIERTGVVDNPLMHHGSDQNSRRQWESPVAASPAIGSGSEEEDMNSRERERERQWGVGRAGPDPSGWLFCLVLVGQQGPIRITSPETISGLF